MIKIIKATDNEIIVKEGPTVYSTTPATAKREVLEALEQSQKEAEVKKESKKTNKKAPKKEDAKTKKTTKKTKKEEE